MKHRLHIYLDQETKLEIEQIAKHQRTSQSKVIVELIREHYKYNYN